MEAEIRLPDKLVPVFEGGARYRGAFGGRGSGKTRTFAKMAAVHGLRLAAEGQNGIILCGREYMNSLDESSMAEVKSAIAEEPWLAAHYEVGEKYIRTKDRRIEFKFAGLWRNLDSIKSKSRIHLLWVDEADPVTEAAWIKVVPSVREHGSEIWVTWNPERKNSATDKRFRIDPPDGAKIVELNYRDNPWFPEVLELERQEDKKKRPEQYDHIWEGDYQTFVDGAYYARDILQAKHEGRVCSVPYDPYVKVFTAWDLGFTDSTAVWFGQLIGKEIHLIDYLEENMQPLAHYVDVLKAKPYEYDHHYFPHDVQAHELTAGQSRVKTLRDLGIEPTIVPQHAILDGINATRRIFHRMWFDEKKTDAGVQALSAYCRAWDDKKEIFGPRPVHNWASHGADAMRCFAAGFPDNPITKTDRYRRDRSSQPAASYMSA